MKRDTRQRLLDLVLARLGWNQAAKQLGIDAPTLDAWVSGRTQIPDEKVREIIDTIDRTNEG